MSTVACWSIFTQTKQPRPMQSAPGDYPGFVEVGLRALGADACAGETTQPSAGKEAIGR